MKKTIVLFTILLILFVPTMVLANGDDDHDGMMGNNMMGFGMGFGMGWFGWVFMILLLIVLILVIVILAKQVLK